MRQTQTIKQFGMRLTMLFLTLFIAAFFTNCQKQPMHGKLDGRWQLLSFQTADGVVHQSTRIYYSIQLQLMEVSEKEGPVHGYIAYIGRFHYDKEAERVTVSDFRLRGQESVEATPADLLLFGINNTTTHFDVVHADGDKLVLKSDFATLTFRSF